MRLTRIITDGSADFLLKTETNSAGKNVRKTNENGDLHLLFELINAPAACSNKNNQYRKTRFVKAFYARAKYIWKELRAMKNIGRFCTFDIETR